MRAVPTNVNRFRRMMPQRPDYAAIRDIMRMEMPDRVYDVTDPPITLPNAAVMVGGQLVPGVRSPPSALRKCPQSPDVGSRRKAT